MLKSDIEFLKHIKEETEFILEYTLTISEEEFLANPLLKKAIIRCLEIIGKATKKVNFDFRIKYSAVPWKEMAGLRDKLIHDYSGVDYILLFQIIKENIPELHFQIEQIINEHDNK
jgi:uncharacterized protein with HEPN domain